MAESFGDAPSDESPDSQEEVVKRKDPETVRREEDAASRRRFLYADVETLLLDGFLSSAINLSENTIVIRTMNPTQMRSFKGRLSAIRKERDASKWFIASSIWMIDGLDVSGDPNSAYHIMNEWLSGVREEFIEVFYASALGLRRRLERAISLTESFCYEPYSRSAWRMLGSTGFNDGEDNSVRKIWAAHNQADDEYYKDMRVWEHTKAQVASMSGKGAQHLARELKKIEEQEEVRRKKTIMDAIEEIAFGGRRPTKKVTLEVNGKSFEVDHLASAVTVEELEDQMARLVRGEKDAHDVVVEEYFRSIRERKEQRQRDYEDAVRKAREASGDDVAISGSFNMVGYTAEQLRELGVPENSGLKVGSDQSAAAEHLYDKILSADIKAGWLSTAGVPEAVGKDSGGASLQGKIKARKPSLESLSEEG